MVPYKKDIGSERIGEITEKKQHLKYRDVEDTLSEWELSRQTSKTWSMEQD